MVHYWVRMCAHKYIWIGKNPRVLANEGNSDDSCNAGMVKPTYMQGVV